DRIGAAELDVGCAPAQRPLEVDDATRGEERAQRAARFLLDLFPAGRRDRRSFTEQMIHFGTPVPRRLPMPRLPSAAAVLLSPPLSPSPWITSASIPVIGPSVNRKVLRCSA